MSNKIISIIIPVFNVEDFIRECLDSILCQSYKSFEVILVENNSTDSSEKICKEYKKLDNRIRIIHCEEQGCGSARNEGLKEVKGEYVTFIDADDLIPKNYLEVLLKHSNGDDIVYVRHFPIDTKPKLKNKTKIVPYKKILTNYFRGNLLTTAWGKLIPTKYFENLKFYKGYYEDLPVMYKVLLRSSKLIECFDTFYIYRKRENSLTTSSDGRKYLSVIDNLEIIKKDLQANASKKNMSDFYYYQVRFFLLFYKYSFFDTDKKVAKKRNFIIKYFRRNLLFLLFKNLHLYVKVALIIFCISPKLFLVINKLILIFKKYVLKNKYAVIPNYKKR